jgi:hypothetical protein
MVYYKTDTVLQRLIDYANGVVGISIIAIKFDPVKDTWVLVYRA